MLHGDVGELQRRLDKITLLLVQTARVGHVLHQIVELILGDGHLALAFGEPGGPLADGGQHHRHRGEKAHKKAQRTGGAQAEPLAVFFRNGLGEHLPYEEQYQRGGQGAPRHGAHAPPVGHQQGDHRRGGQVGDIGADQDRGDGPVEVVQHPHGFFCPVVALLQPDPDTVAGHGGEGRLREGEIHRHAHQCEDKKDRQPTAIIHREEPPLAF